MTDSFTFEKVALQQNEEFSFDKLPAGAKINKLNFGLGWRPATMGRDIDLDASLIVLDKDNN